MHFVTLWPYVCFVSGIQCVIALKYKLLDDEAIVSSDNSTTVELSVRSSRYCAHLCKKTSNCTAANYHFGTGSCELLMSAILNTTEERINNTAIGTTVCSLCFCFYEKEMPSEICKSLCICDFYVKHTERSKNIVELLDIWRISKMLIGLDYLCVIIKMLSAAHIFMFKALIEISV